MPLGILNRSRLTPTREALNLPADSNLEPNSKFAFWTWTSLGYVMPSNGQVLDRHQEFGFLEFQALWIVEGESGLSISRETAKELGLQDNSLAFIHLATFDDVESAKSDYPKLTFPFSTRVKVTETDQKIANPVFTVGLGEILKNFGIVYPKVESLYEFLGTTLSLDHKKEIQKSSRPSSFFVVQKREGVHTDCKPTEDLLSVTAI